MEVCVAHEDGLNLKATELRLGLPGTEEGDDKEMVSSAKNSNNKRALPEPAEEDCESKSESDARSSPVSKAQIVGWPPLRSYRKNTVQTKKSAETGDGGMYVKVSMDGAPYLRKIDLKMYKCYPELLGVLENMFKLTIGDYSEREGYKGSEYAPAYEDKDGDLMLVGDVPWEMFLSSCKRLRIMKGQEARGLGCGV
ncbi:auxin-responsive protein IAA4-like [Ipomoea triloba]|uniref:auxin-responsive protein IAA4-like n=1 Tax=Ipomoea triloba TaxID=35885 RepID=UPI00125E5110|nr:auxin-responsive protein IAA4-like [Ipomoea triloba]